MPGLSNWREEFNLSEVVTGKMTDKEALKKVSEKSGINNKVTINPKLDEAVKEIGGEVIGMVEQDTTAQHQRLDMKQMILDRQKLKIRRKDLSQAKREKKEGEEGDSSNAMKQANVIASEETVKQVNEKKRKNALQIQKVIGEEELDERLGGKGYQPYTSLTGKKISGDWEDSDRGAGNKAKKRAGGKVEKKSPTYLAHVHNKEGYEAKKTSEVLAAFKRDPKVRKRFEKAAKKEDGPGSAKNRAADSMLQTAKDTAKRKGDTSKSDDRYAYEETILEKDLNAAERRALPNKDFALPGKGKGPEGKQAGSYPIPDEKHARSALSLVAQHGTPEEKATVRAKVKKKFPNIEVNEGVMKMVKKVMSKKKPEKKAQKAMDAGAVARRKMQQKDHETVNFLPMDEAKVDTGRSDYGKASIRNYRRSGPGHGEPAMFDPENKRGKLIDKRREEHKARRGVKGAKVPAYKVNEEDKAFNFVLDKIRKEVGKDGYVSKNNPRKPQSAADKEKVRAHQAKVDKENAAARAKDPSQGRYPKG